MIRCQTRSNQKTFESQLISKFFVKTEVLYYTALSAIPLRVEQLASALIEKKVYSKQKWNVGSSNKENIYHQWALNL